jgi:hypothetical protein
MNDFPRLPARPNSHVHPQNHCNPSADYNISPSYHLAVCGAAWLNVKCSRYVVANSGAIVLVEIDLHMKTNQE